MENRYDATWESVRSHTVPAWYDDCKLGIFIHWGAYSVPAWAPPTCELGEIDCDETWYCNNPYAEWYFNSINVRRGPTWEHHKEVWGEDFPYENFSHMWKAEHWDPAAWASLFREAGAGYVVLTTKHHDGLCLFPSRHTGYTTMALGPRRDIMGELTRAVRAEGMKMGAYYSGIIDWRFAHDPIFHDAQNFTNACPTYEYADYAYKQVMELIDRYQPSVLWNDIGWPKRGEDMLPHLLAHYYNTVPEGVIDDRWNGLVRDFASLEYKSGQVTREQKWEMCRGMGLSFGYNAVENDSHLLSSAELVSLLAGTVANGGNLLINIGPMEDGTIPPAQVDRLRALGAWLRTNGEAIYGTRCADRLSETTGSGIDIHYTAKNDVLYVLLDHLPAGDTTVTLRGLHGALAALDPATQFACADSADGLIVTLSAYDPARCAAAFRLA